MIRIGFWGPFMPIIIIVLITRSPQNSIGKYLGPYIIRGLVRIPIPRPFLDPTSETLTKS